MKVAIVHDHIVQRSGGERVLLTMLDAFPGSVVHTSVYDRGLTFPEFADERVRPMALNRVAALRRHHRLGLPLLMARFASLQPDADVVLCSSAGLSHTVRSRRPKVVYCFAPARWLYQGDRYLGERSAWKRAVLGMARLPLVAWDRRAAHRAAHYLTSSTAVQAAIERAYGIAADVLPPPVTFGPGPSAEVDGVEPGYVLCVSRLLPYKNVAAVSQAFRALPDRRLVVVGTGPQGDELRADAPPNVRFLGAVSEEELRWLYASADALVAASYEDFGLTPLEAARFGKPSAVLRWGGFLDTVEEGHTGVFFDAPEPGAIAAAVRALDEATWDADALRRHAERFSEDAFVAGLRAAVERAAGGG